MQNVSTFTSGHRLCDVWLYVYVYMQLNILLKNIADIAVIFF